ncbi:cytochrome P460 family protein [Vibrio sp. FJH11]
MLRFYRSLSLLYFGLFSLCASVWAGGELVQFPNDYSNGILYTTVHRGNIKEDIYVNQEAIEAVKNGLEIPSGTVITLVDYRDNELYRYVVMEKRAGWGSQYTDDLRNGEWEYQAFHADRSVNTEENLSRCFSCHKSQADNDYVYTLNRMKSN